MPNYFLPLAQLSTPPPPSPFRLCKELDTQRHGRGILTCSTGRLPTLSVLVLRTLITVFTRSFFCFRTTSRYKSSRKRGECIQHPACLLGTWPGWQNTNTNLLGRVPLRRVFVGVGWFFSVLANFFQVVAKFLLVFVGLGDFFLVSAEFLLVSAEFFQSLPKILRPLITTLLYERAKFEKLLPTLTHYTTAVF